MFTDELTLADATPTNHVYGRVVSGDYKTIRRVASSDLGKPELLTISHQLDKTGMNSRSLVRFDTTVEDAAGVKGVISVQLVVGIPRDQADATAVKHVIKQMQNFLSTSGFQDKLINLEN
jgi:hypothetical protein